MKKAIIILFSLILFNGFLSPNYGWYGHVFADQIIKQVSEMRGSNPAASQLASIILNLTNKKQDLLPSNIIDSDNLNIRGLARKITEGKKSDTEKSKAIYFWVTHHMMYDMEALHLLQTSSSIKYKTVSQILEDQKGLCTDFSSVDAALHRAVGIEAKVVYNTEHAWDEIKLNGKWISQDCTFGSGYIDTNSGKFIKQYDEKYFNHVDFQKRYEFKW